MALPKEVDEDMEFAKTKLMQSSLDDTCKKSLLKLLNASKLATNGLSLEDKVQKVTESIFGMIISQIAFLDAIDKKIDTANKEQCKTCRAMKLVNDVEEQKKQEEIINAWKEANGYKDSDKRNADPSKMSLYDAIKTILVKPWAWVFGAILVFSPYGVQIVDAILNFFQK